MLLAVFSLVDRLEDRCPKLRLILIATILSSGLLINLFFVKINN